MGTNRCKSSLIWPEALEGMPRNASTHAAGVVITKLPVERLCAPVQK